MMQSIFGLVWFLFLKTIFCSQKGEEQRKQGKHDCQFVFVLKNIKNIENSKFK